MKTNPLLGLKSLGQSVWLDDIHRRMLTDGTLSRLISADGIAGLTSNPAIFATSIQRQEEYQRAAAALLAQFSTSTQLYEELVLEDISSAAELFRPVFDATGGREGFVSIEVSPHLAHDSLATLAEALRLWKRLDRPNIMIKVPGTRAGLEAVRDLVAAGINVNITLLFSVERYQAVADAYMRGLEDRVAKGLSIVTQSSVASFFLSRIDSHIDPLLEEQARCGRVEARALKGRTAVACAALAYDQYQRLIQSPRWRALATKGAQTQRLLWASTSTKNPAYSDVKYVEELVAPDTINTMPAATVDAFRDHGVPKLSLESGINTAAHTLDALKRLDINPDVVSERLEAEGVRKFAEPFDQLQLWLDQQRAASGKS